MAGIRKNIMFEREQKVDEEYTVVTSELIAKYLLGTASFDEWLTVTVAMDKYPWVREVVEISQEINKSFSESKNILANPFSKPITQRKLLPAIALAASSEVNDCVVKCEHYVLNSFGKEAEYPILQKDAVKYGWLRESGTPLYNIGRLLEMAQLSVARKFQGTLNMVKKELDGGCSVIVALNVERLTQNKCPAQTTVANHAVVVVNINFEEGYVELYDPQSSNPTDRYAISRFIKAWKPAENYFVSIAERGARPYTPHPEYVAHIKLPEHLLPLVDMFAENAHEIWAVDRLKEADKKIAEGENVDPYSEPFMKPFCELTKKERKTDYTTAINTIKLLYKIGYSLSEEKSNRYKFKSNVRTADGQYIPRPIPVDDVVLPEEIARLTEYIAENAHEEWAKQRFKEGWVFAPKTNKKLKMSFDLVPYCELLDSEKEYDRKMAMNTLRVLYKLGYRIEKGSR